MTSHVTYHYSFVALATALTDEIFRHKCTTAWLLQIIQLS